MQTYMNENELLYLYRQNNDEATSLLVNQYYRLVWSIVFRFRGAMDHMGISKDDLFQEGMCGLMEAIECYRDELAVPFKNFACLCIERQIRSLIRKHKGQSYALIHNSISLDKIISEDENLMVMDTIASRDLETNPVWQFYYKESCDFLAKTTQQLSDLEKKVLYLRYMGYTYNEIAIKCECNFKAVDNTLQKIKRKIGPLFD
jgi:RNA polymerase sporulation-specific sigma factor